MLLLETLDTGDCRRRSNSVGTASGCNSSELLTAKKQLWFQAVNLTLTNNALITKFKKV